jgi:hypothetical protein
MAKPMFDQDALMAVATAKATQLRKATPRWPRCRAAS